MESYFGNPYEQPVGAPPPDSPETREKKIQEMHQMLTGDLSHHEDKSLNKLTRNMVPGTKATSLLKV